MADLNHCGSLGARSPSSPVSSCQFGDGYDLDVNFGEFAFIDAAPHTIAEEARQAVNGVSNAGSFIMTSAIICRNTDRLALVANSLGLMSTY